MVVSLYLFKIIHFKEAIQDEEEDADENNRYVSLSSSDADSYYNSKEPKLNIDSVMAITSPDSVMNMNVYSPPTAQDTAQGQDGALVRQKSISPRALSLAAPDSAPSLTGSVVQLDGNAGAGNGDDRTTNSALDKKVELKGKSATASPGAEADHGLNKNKMNTKNKKQQTAPKIVGLDTDSDEVALDEVKKSFPFNFLTTTTTTATTMNKKHQPLKNPMTMKLPSPPPLPSPFTSTTTNNQQLLNLL